MKRVDDRLHHTLEDLAIGHYIIEYVQGKQNTVADALSRAKYPWALPDEPEFKERTEDLPFDQNQWLLRTVPGGPGLLCDCLTAVLGLSPAASASLRETLVELMLIKPEKYGFSRTARDRNRIEALKAPMLFYLSVCYRLWPINMAVSLSYMVWGDRRYMLDPHKRPGDRGTLGVLGGHSFQLLYTSGLGTRCCGWGTTISQIEPPSQVSEGT